MKVVEGGGADLDASSRRGSVEKAIGRLASSEKHLFLLEMWQADVRAFVMQRTDVVEEMRRLRGELYQIISMSLIFEGVILTAVAQTKNLNCSLCWSPLLLALLVAFPASYGIFSKSRDIRHMEDERDLMDDNICSTMDAIQRLHLEGPSHREEEDTEMMMMRIRAKNAMLQPSNADSRKCLSLSTVSVMGLIVIFAIIVAVFSCKTLCAYCPGC